MLTNEAKEAYRRLLNLADDAAIPEELAQKHVHLQNIFDRADVGRVPWRIMGLLAMEYDTQKASQASTEDAVKPLPRPTQPPVKPPPPPEPEPFLDDEDDLEEGSIDWSTVEPGTRVTVNWRGEQRGGIFLTVGPANGRLKVALDRDVANNRDVPAERVTLAERAHV